MTHYKELFTPVSIGKVKIKNRTSMAPMGPVGYADAFGGFSQRLQVTPGITGWAQINGGYELLPGEKILFDMEYIRRRSVMFDIRCLLGTVRVVFRHDGAR